MKLLKSVMKMMLCAGMILQVSPAVMITAEETEIQVSEDGQSIGIFFSEEPVDLEMDFLPQAERYEITIIGESLELISENLNGKERLLKVRTLGYEDADILIDCISGEEIQQVTVHISVLPPEESEEPVEEIIEEEETPAETDSSSFSITYDDFDGVYPSGYQKQTSFTEGDSISLPDLTKPGYTFLGWKITGTEDAPATSFEVSSLPAGNIGFTAVFEVYEYKITVDYDAGEPAKEMASKCSADKPAVLPEASRPSKVLSGYDVTLSNGVTYTLDAGEKLPDAVLKLSPSYFGLFDVRAVWMNDPSGPKEDDKLHFIHLGNGSSDGFLIESNGHYGLIDTSNASSSRHPDFDGSKYSDLNRTGSVVHIIYYLKMLGISHLDFVLSTHSHSDHIGGVPELCKAGYIDENTVYIYKNYAVQVDDQENDDAHHWYNKDYFDDAVSAVSAKTAHMLETEDRNATLDLDVTDSYENVMTYLGAEEINDGKNAKGISFSFGDFTVRIYNLENNSLSDENTNSFITLITKGDTGALFMADMNVEMEMEQKIVRTLSAKYNIDIYKLGHHGYTKSSTFETLLRVHPSYVIIPHSSIGNNTSIYTVLKALGAKTYLTGDSERGIIADLSDENTVRMYNIKDSDTLSAALKEWTPSTFNFGWCRNAYQEDEYNYIYMNSDRTLKYGWNNMSDGRWYYFDHTYGIMAPAQGMNGSLNDMIQIISEDDDTYTVRIKDDSSTSSGTSYKFNKRGYLINTSALPDAYKKTGWETTEAGKIYWKADFNKAIGWQKIGKSWYYFGADTYLVTGWQKISGNTFYFGKDGKLLTGLQDIGKNTYYFNSDTKTGTLGAQMTGVQNIGGNNYYFFRKSAPSDCYQLKGTGWKQADSSWYYLNKGNVLHSGWIQSGGKWYYLAPVMVTGWRKVSGVWYWFNSSGAMVTGWQKISGKWYWFNSSGAMITGWKQLSGKWYWFDSSGAMVAGWRKISGVWYWFNSSGAMMTGWQKISGKWYWFNSSGAMVTGKQTINGKEYRFDASGAWIG